MRFIKRTPILVIFLGIFVMAATTLYLIFDLHLNRMTEELLMSWIKAEAVSIQQGQLLSSFAKNQRFLSSSDLVKGVSLINVEQSIPYAEIQFGNELPTSLINKFRDNEKDLEVVSLGMFHKLGIAKVSNPQKFLVAFETRSYFFERVFLWTTVFFGFLLSMMVYLIRRIEKKQAHYANLAAKVAHDIRSPINTLNHIASTMDLQSQTNQDLLKRTIERLQYIVSDLIEKRTDGFSEPSDKAELPVTATTEHKNWLGQVYSLVEEKKVLHGEFKGREIKLVIESECVALVAPADSLIRTLSNLLDNAIEAIGLIGTVELSIVDRNGLIEFVIKDSGPGVPEELLSQIGKPKFTFGKTNGSGMGVYTAKKFAEQFGGSFDFQSKLGEGTTVTLSIPSVLNEQEKKYVVIDDDILAHYMWKTAIKNEASRLNLNEFKFFTAAKAFEEWLAVNQNPNQKFFVDYDLKDERNGLQVIEDLNLQDRSVLITHSFDDIGVRSRAQSLNISVYSKANLETFVATL